DRWQVMVDSLCGLGETARAAGLRLVVAILPDGDQVGVPEPDLLPQQKVLAVCADAGLECLDLYPAFAAAAPDGELFFDIMALNEAATIAAVVAGVRDIAPGVIVVVVDDGSSDRTARLAAGAGAEVLRLPFNCGIGTAVQAGLRFAVAQGAERVARLDGDGQH